jgi:hypothetical protein
MELNTESLIDLPPGGDVWVQLNEAISNLKNTDEYKNMPVLGQSFELID